jgi:hypothetical protein
MPKHMFCANCGEEVFTLRKALKGRIYDLVEPHTCTKEIALPQPGEGFTITPKPKPKNLDSLFDSFKFVEKINDLNTDLPTGDKRPAEQTRKSLKTSDAPTNLLNSMKTMQNTSPQSDISKEPSDE